MTRLLNLKPETMHRQHPISDKTLDIPQTWKFLLDLVRANSQNDFESVIAKNTGRRHPIDWTALVNLAFKPFLPLYLNELAASPDLKIPPEIRFAIQQRYLLIAGQNEKIKQGMVELAQAFEKAKIELIFLKGAALLTTVYRDDPGLRPMDDIDCLVRKNDLPQAEKIMERLGYQEDYEKLSAMFHTDVSREYYTEKHCHYVFFRDRIRIDLHWDILRAPETLPFLDTLFADSQQNEIDHTGVSILSPETQLFVTCLNYLRDSPAYFSNHWHLSAEETRKAFCYTVSLLYEIKRIISFYGDKMIWEKFSHFTRLTHTGYPILSLLWMAVKMANLSLPPHGVRILKRGLFTRLFMSKCRKTAYDDFPRLFLTREFIRGLTLISFLGGHPKQTIKTIYGSVLPYLFVYHKRTHDVIQKFARFLKWTARILK